jgi:hypothetical protein
MPWKPDDFDAGLVRAKVTGIEPFAAFVSMIVGEARNA